jgi:hypothetical protein
VPDKNKVRCKSIVNETLNKIKNYFEDLINYETVKINYKKIAQNIGMSEKSIIRHITIEQKQLIKKHNLKIKQSKKIQSDINDSDFIFNQIPDKQNEISVCATSRPIKEKEICENSNTAKEFEQFIFTNNNNQYEFIDETIDHITDHFNANKINWLKSNICECIELKRKLKLYEHCKRELLYI